HKLGVFINVLFGFPKYAVWFGFKFIAIILLNLLMLAGLISGFHYVVNPPSWSISVELVLYATMFPLLVRFGKKLNHWIVWTILVASLLMLYCCHGHLLPQRIYDWSWTFLGRGIFGFTIGFFICSVIRANLLSEAVQSNLVRGILLYGVTPLLYLCSINGILPDGSIVFVFPILVFYTALNERAYGGVLASRPLQWLGDRSYSIYLWHYPILAYYKKLPKEFIELKYPLSAVINCSLVILVVLTISAVSYQYFEIPCREFIRKLGSIKKPVLAIAR
ncbi:MAG: acyltransferase, partial [bacterium]